VRRYLPDLRLADESVAGRLTARHLVTHVSGFLGDYFADFGGGDDALGRYVASMVELPQLTPLGEVWSYNNAAFAIAGRLVEVITGLPYELALRELVLDPLGLARATCLPAEVMTERYATGHMVDDERTSLARPWALPRSINAVGGLIASAPDLLRYARFHLGVGSASDDARVLAPETVAAMQAAQAPAGNQADAVGLSWMLNDIGGTRLVGHGGLTNGQAARLAFAPGRDFAVAVLTNAHRGASLHGEIVAWALRRCLGVDPPPPPTIDMPAEQLAAYAGRYTAVLDDAELWLEDGVLVMRLIPAGGFPYPDSPPPPALPPTRLAFTAEDRVIALDPPLSGSRSEFLRDGEGRIVWFRTGGRIHRRLGDV
jgi:CubicO group peptidase (beta-lactamase class C family)